MKINLISPRGSTTGDEVVERIFSDTKDFQGYIESLTKASSSGLLVIASLTPAEHDVRIIDENYDAVDYNDDCDLVGISAMTQQATRAYEIADEFRKRGRTVVMGGIHATVMPEEAKKHCDCVFIGEAEETWPVFLDDFRKGTISDYYRSGKPADMTMLPVPRYDLLNKDNYKVIWLQTSRGCPHDCEFCAASRIYGHSYRHKTVEQVVREINAIQDIWPDARINFADDNLFVNRKYSRELVGRLKELNIRWFAQTDIAIANDVDLLRQMKSAGCTTLLIGFESISEKNLQLINSNGWKLKKASTYADAIRTIQSCGIGIVGAFIIGLDEDTKESLDELAEFIIDNNIFMAQISILTPFPGTRLCDRLMRERRILDRPWSDYTGMQVNIQPRLMGIEELQKGFYKIYQRIYDKDVRVKTLKHFKSIFKTLSCTVENE
ncbi:MAG TPA: radical SAM protein [Spirochaetota bacterium]|nr:radical SAM protein [Spirochaetota bacterium]HPC39300.1 radical SAM protein [Spirochaetota bacterium]HQF08762.1 radical SAM protein [Spirochaetota bacterium]HQH97537.1 radical SAM protein [Spirochaetota bacterium]HQJ71248.1 radical SAM protein [Spirochaetota bacterium]